MAETNEDFAAEGFHAEILHIHNSRTQTQASGNMLKEAAARNTHLKGLYELVERFGLSNGGEEILQLKVEWLKAHLELSQLKATLKNMVPKHQYEAAQEAMLLSMKDAQNYKEISIASQIAVSRLEQTIANAIPRSLHESMIQSLNAALNAKEMEMKNLRLQYEERICELSKIIAPPKNLSELNELRELNQSYFEEIGKLRMILASNVYEESSMAIFDEKEIEFRRLKMRFEEAENSKAEAVRECARAKNLLDARERELADAAKERERMSRETVPVEMFEAAQKEISRLSKMLENNTSNFQFDETQPFKGREPSLTNENVFRVHSSRSTSSLNQMISKTEIVQRILGDMALKLDVMDSA